MHKRIKEILEQVIGSPRTETEGWLEYNCIFCAQEKGVEKDDKYNLAVNYGNDGVTKPFFHCWRCGESGKLSKLVKEFGSPELYEKYKEEVYNLRNSSYYMLFNDSDGGTLSFDEALELPENYRKINEKDKYCDKAIEYLYKRGLNMDIINRFNIGYVPYWSKDNNMKERIIIPSYNAYNDLNYYVARDYTGKRIYRKYNNPLVKKTMFVFNEWYVNWYEDVTLVEGAFDHIVVPNSIPLLGKTLKKDYETFSALVNKAKANVNVFLDDDAIGDAVKIYKLLNSTVLKDRIRIVECPDGYDASDIYCKYKERGIIDVLRSARKLEEYEL